MKLKLSALAILAGLTAAFSQYGQISITDVTRWGSWNMQIQKINLNVEIEGPVARHVLTLNFEDRFSDGGSDSMEMLMEFELPDKAVVDSMYLWINGEPESAYMKTLMNAWRIYSSIVRVRRDPALLMKSWWGNGYSLRVFPFPTRGQRKVRICYTVPAECRFGKFRHTLPFSLSQISSENVDVLNATVLVKNAGREHLLLENMSAKWNITEVEGNVRAVFRGTNIKTDREPVIGIANSELEQNGLSVHFSKNENGAVNFMAWIDPEKALSIPKRPPKNILLLWNLVYEYDYSWRGRETEYYGYNVQQKASELLGFIEKMIVPGDQLAVLINGLEVLEFQDNFGRVNENTYSRLKNFVNSKLMDGYDSGGLPNYEFLNQSLDRSLDFSDCEIIMIDEYQGYYSEQQPSLDLEAYFDKLPSGARFSGIFSQGHTVVADLYQGLVDRTGGKIGVTGYNGSSGSYFEAPLMIIGSLLRGRLYPASIDILSGGGGFVYSLMGPSSDEIYLGHPLMYMGRIYGGDKLSISIAGRKDGQNLSFSAEIPLDGHMLGNLETGTIWAAARVNSLLASGYYWDSSVWQEATDLSLDYRILTRATALLALEDGLFPDSLYQDDKPVNPEEALGIGKKKKDKLPELAMSAAVVNNMLVISLPVLNAAEMKDGFSLRIYDVNGKMAADLSDQFREGMDKVKYNVSKMKKGRYLIRLQIGQKIKTVMITLGK